MRAVLAIAATLALFVFTWLLCAVLLWGLLYVGVKSGVKPGLFMFLHIVLAWIVSPGLGAGVAVHAASTKFKDVNPHTIFVSFVTVASVVVFLMFALISLLFAAEQKVGANFFLLFFQAAAVFSGAWIGRATARYATGNGHT